MGLLEKIEAFIKAKNEFEAVESAFKATKKQFYAYVEKSINTSKIDKKIEVPTADHSGDYILTRVQRVKVTWDAEKVEAALKNTDKELCAEIVQKELTLADKKGFIEYAKSLGAEPKKLFSFFVVNKTVDDKALNKLTEVGAIDETKLGGCYDVKADEPYWRVVYKERAKPAEQA